MADNAYNTLCHRMLEFSPYYHNWLSKIENWQTKLGRRRLPHEYMSYESFQRVGRYLFAGQRRTDEVRREEAFFEENSPWLMHLDDEVGQTNNLEELSALVAPNKRQKLKR